MNHTLLVGTIMTHWEALSSKACGRAQETHHHQPCYLPCYALLFTMLCTLLTTNRLQPLTKEKHLA